MEGNPQMVGQMGLPLGAIPPTLPLGNLPPDQRRPATDLIGFWSRMQSGQTNGGQPPSQPPQSDSNHA